MAAPLENRGHGLLRPENGIHAIHAWDVADLEVPQPDAEPGKVARTPHENAGEFVFYLMTAADPPKWVALGLTDTQRALLEQLGAVGSLTEADRAALDQLAAGNAPRRITQIASAHAEGVTPVHCGAVTFDPGAQLLTASSVVIGSAGSAGMAVLELIDEAGANVVARWESSSALASVALGADVTFVDGALCSLVLRGELADTRAILRGLDWRVK